MSYPGCEGESDNSAVFAWAGWDHLQRARALAEMVVRGQEEEGWEVERLRAVLDGLGELVPWLRQWFSETEHGDMGAYFAGFVEGRRRELG